MKAIFRVICILAVVYCGGCSTPVQQVPSNTHAFILKEPQTRELPIGTVSVPAGVYQPDFAAKNGIYYRAPGHLIVKALGLSAIQRGGIFIPNPPTEAEQVRIEKEKVETARQRARGAKNIITPMSEDKFLQGVWYDQQEASGGLIIYAASSPKRIFHVKEPFVYEIETNMP